MCVGQPKVVAAHVHGHCGIAKCCVCGIPFTTTFTWVRGHSELAREKCELVGAWQTRLGLVTNVDWGQHDPVVAKLYTARWSCCSKDTVSAMSYTRKPPGRPRLASL